MDVLSPFVPAVLCHSELTNLLSNRKPDAKVQICDQLLKTITEVVLPAILDSERAKCVENLMPVNGVGGQKSLAQLIGQRKRAIHFQSQLSDRK